LIYFSEGGDGDIGGGCDWAGIFPDGADLFQAIFDREMVCDGFLRVSFDVRRGGSELQLDATQWEQGKQRERRRDELCGCQSFCINACDVGGDACDCGVYFVERHMGVEHLFAQPG
jgi:hypothetical protein